jgi:hypothetical protein
VSGRYHFYLSFPHAFPFTGQSPDDLDKWSRLLFRDLCAAVRRGDSSASVVMASGFADQEPDADWRSGLRGAEAFVPLYSPLYFARTRTARERETFVRRMTGAGVAQPEDRIVPVLWTPPPRSAEESPWVRQCLELKDAPSSYVDNGLQALLRLWMFRADYERVVGLLAERILAISRSAPIGPSSIDDSGESAPADFAVIIAAPAGWHPFPADQSLTIARYAERAAERLDFAVTTSALEDTADPAALPGVVLVDPRYTADEDRAALLDRLPPWAVPVLVGGRDDQVPARFARRARSFRDLAGLLPFLVAEAQRQYVRLGPPP